MAMTLSGARLRDTQKAAEPPRTWRKQKDRIAATDTNREAVFVLSHNYELNT